MIKSYEELVQRVKGNKQKKRVAVAAAHDLHTLEGINNAYINDVILPILIGDEKQIKKIIKEEGFALNGVEIINEEDPIQAAKKTVELIRKGKADILMKGKLQTFELMREVVNQDYGLSTGSIMSHVGLFQIPAFHKLVVLTDGGMIIAPDLKQKKMIVDNAVEVMRKMGYEDPKVAILCATEVENPKIQASVDAAKLKKWNKEGVLKGCTVEGPISFDLMFDKESAMIKGYESPVAGEADIWVLPDMTAGNLVAKSLMCAAKAQMAGVIVGASVPIVVVSRGATSEEKYFSLIFAAAIAR
ncbi:MAG: bifunctional enoyl-CoA hydratase/phosphate acetyltransferase [Anaerovoracaceae bacterium]